METAVGARAEERAAGLAGRMAARGRPVALRLLASAALLALIIALAAAPPTASAGGCTFVLGFKTLHDLVPGVVGDCKSDEYHNPENGDGLQLTTKGLLVWRKADNFTAFTDGYRTWVNGPRGVQVRLNTEWFAWEAGGSAPPLSACASLPESKVKGKEVDVVDWRFEPRDQAGNWAVVGRVRNNCSQTRYVGLSAVVSGQDGQPVGVTSAQYWKLGPTEAKAFSLATGPLPRQASLLTAFSWQSVEPAASDTLDCLDVQTTRCLRTDVWLGGTVRELRRVEPGAWLLRVAAEHGISLRRAELPPGTLGQYSRRSKTVWIDARLDANSNWEKAAVLAHELQHAHDDVAGRLLPGSASCYLSEEDAFRRGAEVWGLLWRGHLPAPQNQIQEELNAISLALARDPASFAAELTRAYRAECARQ